MDIVTLTIDDRPIAVDKGKTVLEAAIAHGISIPYYCYHPGIGIDGSCRVCIVKIEKLPKLQTACSTVCSDGMVVHTRTPEVVEARAAMFEFLLLNHPLDCPVCDKGGECPLQDFSATFGRNRSRMDFPRRVFDGEGMKADVDFGPTLMLNRNRCILCMRCARFMREVEGNAQINVIGRGLGSEIATFQEEGVDSLISGNLMDVCPVGAITTKDYRFKSRPWDNTRAVDTICTLCAKGCNTTAWIKAKPEWAKGARLIRFTPRLNPAVNGYWMCDIGRFGYHWIEGSDRLHRPLARDEDGALQPVSWQALNSKLGDRLAAAGRATPDGVRFLLSAHASNEELFLFRRLTDEFLGDSASGPRAISVSWRHQPKTQPERTNFKVPAVDAPNVNGARVMGIVPGRVGDEAGAADVTSLREAIDARCVTGLYVFDPGPDGSIGDTRWIIDARARGTLPLLVVQGVLTTDLARAADFVLAGASFVEKDASYTNDQGRLQATTRAVPIPGGAMDDWQILVNLAPSLGVTLDYPSAARVRADIAGRFAGVPALQGIAGLEFGRPIPARNWLEASNPSERWKWDFMYRDLPPVKFQEESDATSMPAGAIPLRPVD